MKREPEFKPRRTMGLPEERFDATNETTLIPWFHLLTNLFSTHHYAPPLILNLDESSCSSFSDSSPTISDPSMGTESPSIQIHSPSVSPSQQPVPIKAAVHQAQTSMMTLVNAFGDHLVTIIIHKFARTPTEYKVYESDTIKFFGCAKGIVTNQIFLHLFETFVIPAISNLKATKDLMEKRTILFLDGAGSHAQEGVRKAAKDAHIDLCSFPPHCTHLVQPLDRYVFATLKRGLGSTIPTAPTRTAREKRAAFIESFTDNFSKALWRPTVKASFRDCGICPLNPSVLILRWDEKKALSTPPPAQRRKTNFAEVCGHVFLFDE